MSDDIKPYQFVSKRADKAKKNSEITCVELLQSMIHDIETGQVKCDGMVIAYCLRPTGKPWDFGRYRSNLTRDAECMLLQVSTHKAIQGWVG